MTDWRVVGGRPAGGVVPIAGYKHALVPALCMSALVEGEVELGNVPDVLDTRVLCEIFAGLGAEVERGEGRLRVRAGPMRPGPISEELSARVHGTVYLLPALLARFGVAEVGPSGGCQIGETGAGGARPVQHMLSVLEGFGARFREEGGRLVGRCERLRGHEIDIMDYSTDPRRQALNGPHHSGATKTALMAAVAAEGTTVIHNPHDKEATLDLVAFLRAAGCSIRHERRCFVVEGGRPLRSLSHSVLSDTTEMVTFICHAVHSKARLTLANVTVDAVLAPLRPELEALERMGVELRWGRDSVEVVPPERVHATDVEATGLGVATDSQPFFTLMLTGADGPSTVSDGIWSNRFAYAEALTQLGARLHVDGASVRVTPGRPDRAGQTVRATDTRAASVLCLAALGIEGETRIQDAHHAARGYERFVPKLRTLGAEVEEVRA